MPLGPLDDWKLVLNTYCRTMSSGSENKIFNYIIVYLISADHEPTLSYARTIATASSGLPMAAKEKSSELIQQKLSNTFKNIHAYIFVYLQF